MSKQRLSSDFFFTKLALIVALFFISLMLSDYKRLTSNELIQYILFFIGCSLLFVYICRRPKVYHDNAYLCIEKKDESIQVRFTKIKRIKFSSIGFGENSSHIIKYISQESKLKKIRVFSGLNSTSFSGFIRLVEKNNPEVKISNWSFGINEFFD